MGQLSSVAEKGVGRTWEDENGVTATRATRYAYGARSTVTAACLLAGTGYAPAILTN